MGVLILVGCFLIVRYLMKNAERRTEEKRRAERERLQEEFRRQQAESKQIVAEQIRQAKEQERQARELAKHEEQIRKHEQRISDLEFKAAQAEQDISFLTEMISNLDGMNDYYKMLQNGTVVGSKEYIKYQNKILALDNRTHTAETKLAKAKHIKEMAQKELCA